MKNGFMTVNTNDEGSLCQNAPNPFNHITTIRYVLPVDVQTASIEVSDLTGNVFKVIRVSGNGQQSTTINGGELASGTYLYSLYVNGKKVDTKKMILTR